jgi:FAD/FMN-containing dehydrogenase
VTADSAAGTALERLAAALGPEAVVTDEAERALYARDIFAPLAMPAAVVRPASVEALAAAVTIAADYRLPVTVRGGGASYTLGYPPTRGGGIAIDTARLTAIEIDATRRTVTVEPGVTWAQLDAALAREALRVPYWGPFSGLRATIGGSLSQHAVAMGSGLYESSATPVIALEIIDGRGRTVRTNRPDRPFLRTFGPDLTGLFLGDCGTLGVKARITLRLMRRPTHVAAASFGLPHFAALAQAFDAVASRLIACDMLGLDPEILKGFLGALTPKSALASARAIWSTRSGLLSGAVSLARAALAARDYRRVEHFAALFTVEGWSEREVRAKIATVRELAAAHGSELSNAAPLTIRGNPYFPLTPVAPPDGFRWLPAHGIFSWADVVRFHGAYERWRAAHADEFRTHRLRVTRMFMPLGSTGILYEPTFYWPDDRHLLQEHLAPPEHLARVPRLEAQPETRALVFRMRRELTELMQAEGAQHLQLGKWYPYLSKQDAGARELLVALKRELDPEGILNPGALEFPSGNTRGF